MGSREVSCGTDVPLQEEVAGNTRPLLWKQLPHHLSAESKATQWGD